MWPAFNTIKLNLLSSLLLCRHQLMRKKASSRDCLSPSDSMCFMASRHLISLCSSYATFIFSPLHCHLKRSACLLTPT